MRLTSGLEGAEGPGSAVRGCLAAVLFELGIVVLVVLLAHGC